jgi:hypothetical protein
MLFASRLCACPATGKLERHWNDSDAERCALLACDDKAQLQIDLNGKQVGIDEERVRIAALDSALARAAPGSAWERVGCKQAMLALPQFYAATRLISIKTPVEVVPSRLTDPFLAQAHHMIEKTLFFNINCIKV